MKLLFGILFLFLCSPSFSQMQACPANINFLLDNLTHWQAYTGNNQAGNGPSAIKLTYDSLLPAPTGTIDVSVIPEYNLPAVAGIQVLNSVASDLYGGFPTIPTINGYAYNYAVILGSTSTTYSDSNTEKGAAGGYIRGISYKINVPATPATQPYTMTYAYAMVLENGSHNSNQQPLFSATLTTSDSIITCASPKYFLPTFNNANGQGGTATLDTATALLEGFTLSPVLSPHPDPGSNLPNPPHLQDVWTKGWTEVTFDLSAYRGQQVTLNFEADNCVPGGHFAYAYIALRNTCAGLLITGDSQVCANSSILYTVPGLAGASYQWSVPDDWVIKNGNNSNIIQVTAGQQSGFVIVKEQNSCANLSDSLVVKTTQAVFAVTNPNGLCAPGTINLNELSITSGSSPGLNYTYWIDSAATQPLTDPSTVSSTGIYYIKGTDSNSCYSIVPVTVTINPLPNLIIHNPVPVCAPGTVNLDSLSITAGSSPDLYYSYWADSAVTRLLPNPSSVGSDGIYYIKATDSNSCSSINPVTVTIKPQPVLSTHNPSPVCTPGTINLDSLAVTSGSSPDLNFSYWADSAASQPLPDPSAIANSGTYYIRGADSNHCSVIGPVTLTINQKPVLIVHNPVPVCVPGTINLDSLTLTTGSSLDLSFSYWVDSSGTRPLQDPSGINSDGTYYIKAVDSNTCYSINPVTVMINPLPVLDINNPAPVCMPGTINLDSLTVTSGSSNGLIFSYWADSAASQSLPDPSAINNNGTYYIKAVDSNLCSIVKPVSVTINPLPDLQAGTDTTICLGQGIALDARNATSFLWQMAGNNSLSCSNCANPVATPVITTTYYVAGYSDSGCVKKDSVKITLVVPQDLILPANIDSICKGEGVMLEASGESIYTWSPSQGLNNPNIANPIASPDTTTLYEITASDSLSCFTDTAYIKVLVFANPVVSLNNSASIYLGSSYQINVISLSDLDSISWSPSAGLSCNSCLSPVATPESTTEYIIQVKNEEGCVSQDSIKINVLPCENANIFIPNAFSPNNDGRNDIFYILSIGVKTIQSMLIFNRWGQLVFEKSNFVTNNPNFGWDGNFNGHKAPEDEYIYLVEVICEGSHLVQLSGNFALIR
jgi:gliding motility-associated-like protein